LKTVVEGSSWGCFFAAHFRPSHNCADYIVEVMGDAAGQLPDGLEFPQLLNLLFH
jgi:hypothetical protein